MADPSQLVQFAFVGGIDQSQRDEVLDPTAGFLVLENGRQDKRGGYYKRRGFTYQTLARLAAADGDRSAGYKLFAHDKQTCVINGAQLESYSTAASVNVPCGRVPECALEMVPIPSSGQVDGSITDGILCGNYYVRAFATGTTQSAMYATVVDAQTGAVIRAPELVHTATSIGFVVLATYGTRVLAFFGDASGAVNTIKYRVLNTESAASLTSGWSAAADACTNAPDTRVMSVCSLSNRVALAYVNDSAGTSRVTVRTFTDMGQVETADVDTSSTTPDWVAVNGSVADTLWVAWNETLDVRVKGLDADVLASTLATTATVLSISSNTVNSLHAIDVVPSPTAGQGFLCCNDGSGDRMHVVYFVTSAGAVTVSGTSHTVFNARRMGRLFVQNGRYFALCDDWPTGAKLSAVVCDLTIDGTYGWVRPVASIKPSLALGYPSATASVSGTTVHIPITEVTAQERFYSASTAKLDFASTQRWQPVRHAGKTFLSGGLLAVYDGQSVIESGFVVRPAEPTAVDSGGGSGPNGAYRYAITFEHIDKTGTWHVSSVSDPSESVTVTDNTITVTVRGISMTSRLPALIAAPSSNVRIAIYRTLAGGEPPYYYLGSVDNPLTAATATYSDSTTDATLATREKLYAPSLPGVNGGAQDRRPVSGLMHLCRYNGMLVGALGADLYWSGQDVAGEGTWFNPIFQVPVPGDGPVTGLATQDGTLYAFKRRGVCATAGEPPSDNGAFGGLGVPRQLAVDVGCIDARSIVVTSLGIFFQSERGIELLSRGGQSVDWIGEAVQDTTLAYPVCSAATLDPTQSLVYFELAATESAGLVSGNGRSLVFDLTLRTWVSVDRRASYAGTTDAPAQSAAMIWDGSVYRYAWLETGGRVRPEQSSYLDSGSEATWVTMKAETGWLKFAGIQGYQQIDRVLLLAGKSTDHDVTVSLAYDYASSYAQSLTYTRAAINALSREQLEMPTGNDARCQALRVKIEDATPTGGTVGTGQGAQWVALTFEGIADRSRMRLPAGARG